MHSTIDKMAEPARSSVDRLSSAAHETVDKLASNASHVADRFSEQTRRVTEAPGQALDYSKSGYRKSRSRPSALRWLSVLSWGG